MRKDIHNLLAAKSAETSLTEVIEKMSELTITLCRGDKYKMQDDLANVHIMLEIAQELYQVSDEELENSINENIKKYEKQVKNGTISDKEFFR